MIAQKSQTLADISLASMGSLEGVLLIAALNDISVTDDVKTGKDYLTPQKPLNKAVTGYYLTSNIKPAGGGEILPEGIDYWAIEIDFIVS